MSLGVEHSLKAIEDVTALICDLLVLIENGFGLNAISQIFMIINDLKDLALDAPLVLPELKDLEADEVGKLGSAAYASVVKIISKVKPKAS